MNDPDLYRFYAADVSYFSAKVRPALRYKRLHYTEILPTPPVFRGVIRKRTGLSFIPILVTPDDQTLQDTSEILDTLELRHPEPPLEPKTPVQRVFARIVELYADEFLLLPAMHYRWGTAEGVTDARSRIAAFIGDPRVGGAGADQMQRALPALGVTSESGPAIEAHLGDLLDALSSHLTDHPYLLSGALSLADCSLMGPFYAHLYRDPVPGRVLRKRAPAVCSWIERSSFPDLDARGEWPDGDALPDSLLPLLRVIGRDAVPHILGVVRAVEAWADEQSPGVEPPRALGTHENFVRDTRITRFTNPYTLWMLQRTLDVVRELSVEERGRVGRSLSGTGCEELLAYEPVHRMAKREFKLVLEH